MPFRLPRRAGAALGAALLATGALVVLAASPAPASAPQAPPSSVTALPGWKVSVFARDTINYFHADSIAVVDDSVYVGYQNNTAKDGSDGLSSTVVQYTRSGQVVRTFNVLGHNDGLRWDPSHDVLWALCDEDANPHITTINPRTGAVKLYSVPTPPSLGGFDDAVFVNGKAYIDASNPTLDSNGQNPNPALYQAQLSGDTVQLTPVLQGTLMVTDVVTGQPVQTTLTDPDSLSLVDGQVVLDDQGDSQILSISNLGTSQQSVSRLQVGTQVDDTLTSSADRTFLLSDTSGGAVYLVHVDLKGGGTVASAPSDSGVAGFVGTLSRTKGTINPAIIGLVSPHGMAFLPPN